MPKANTDSSSKFEFDLEFQDAAGNRMPSPEELAEKARAEGFAEGQTAGKQQAAQEYSTQLTTHLGRLDEALASVEQAKHLHAQIIQKQMLDLTGTLLTYLIGDARANYSDEILQKGLKDLDQDISAATTLVLRCHPTTQQVLNERQLEGSPFAGATVNIKPDPSLKPGDLLAEWDTGGVDACLDAKIDDIIDALQAARTSPTGELSAADTPQSPEPEVQETPADVAENEEVD